MKLLAVVRDIMGELFGKVTWVCKCGYRTKIYEKYAAHKRNCQAELCEEWVNC